MKLTWTVTTDPTHPDPTAPHATADSEVVTNTGQPTSYSIGKAWLDNTFIPMRHAGRNDDLLRFDNNSAWLDEFPTMQAAQDAAQQYEDMLLSHPSPDGPLPGDAVILATAWMTADAGQIGVIGGVIGERMPELHITFSPRTYRDDTRVSVSGGPGSMYTPAAELQPSGQTVDVTVWRFKNGIRRAHNTEDYTVTVPLWRWTPASNA